MQGSVAPSERLHLAASRAIANSGSTSCFHSDRHFLRLFLFRDVGSFFFGLAFLLVWLGITCNTPSSWAFGILGFEFGGGFLAAGFRSFWLLVFLASWLFDFSTSWRL